MNLPAQTQRLIEHYLEEVRLDPQHHLPGASRLAIYKSFGKSRFSRNPCPIGQNYERFMEIGLKTSTVADYARGWLAVITATHVLFIWERDYNQLDYHGISTPQDILQVAEEVLHNKADVTVAIRLLCNEFNWPVEVGAKYDFACAYRSAYFALEMILSDSEFLGFLSQENDKAEDIRPDFASTAMQAYSFVNAGSDDTWFSVQKPEFDPQKYLEFWEGWLTVAIPQAWKLANQRI